MLNINDNTVTERGIESLVTAFDSCEMIEKLDLGDCLLRSKGAKILSRKLCHLKRLRSLNLSYNEIDASAGKMIVNAVATSGRDWIMQTMYNCVIDCTFVNFEWRYTGVGQVERLSSRTKKV